MAEQSVKGRSYRELYLSKRVAEAVKRLGHFDCDLDDWTTTVESLISMTDLELMEIPGVGPAACIEIRNKIRLWQTIGS